MATFKYDAYTFSPVPQIGVQDSVNRIGDNGMGPGNRERTVTAKGILLGSNLNEVETKIDALKAAMAAHGKTLYWNDGTTTRINTIAQPVSVSFPEQWGQYDAEYTVTFKYFPLGETHYSPFAVSIGSYSFSPIPSLTRSYTVRRQGDNGTQQTTKVSVTLTGFLDKGSQSANETEWQLLRAQLVDDNTLSYGSISQTVKIGSYSAAPTFSGRLIYSVEVSYNVDLGTGGLGAGVLEMQSTRNIQSSQRVAINRTPFVNNATLQLVGGNEQMISANGSIVAQTIAQARTAAATEIDAQFPASASRAEMTRQITENAQEKRVDWSVQMVYPTPILTGGVYGDLTI